MVLGKPLSLLNAEVCQVKCLDLMTPLGEINAVSAFTVCHAECMARLKAMRLSLKKGVRISTEKIVVSIESCVPSVFGM
jgi:hypothetical protein